MGSQAIIPRAKWERQIIKYLSHISSDWFEFNNIHVYLGVNSIVFEDMPASIDDLMVANWVYWQSISRVSKQIFLTVKSKLMLTNIQIQYCLTPF